MGTVNTTFPKGAALASWLQTVGATTTRGTDPALRRAVLGRRGHAADDVLDHS